MHRPISLNLPALLLILWTTTACSPLAARPSGELARIAVVLNDPAPSAGQPSQTPLAVLDRFTPQPASSQTPEPTQAPTWKPAPIFNLDTLSHHVFPQLPTPLPAEYIITGFRGHHQLLAIDCEAAAAVDWAKHFGVVIDEREFQLRLPHSDNPDYGFVGDVSSVWGKLPPHGYGVYAGPVADLINTYGVQAKAYKGYTLEQIKAKIAQDIPVMAWVTGNVAPGVPVVYTDSLGRTYIAAAFEHVVIITGYDASHIRYISEGITQFTTTRAFLSSWGVLGNMVVVDR
jgi:uncharacterized protein YvpB